MDLCHPNDLADLRATVAALQADLARIKRGQGLRRPLLPLLLAGLLVALVPLATLAANPFTDLNPGSPHNGNIDLIYNAGITTGCDPGVAYCPSGTVTREEMASFLARTAGLGNNPPIVNARTAVQAQTATTATTAQNAVTAQTATNATTAQSAANADTLGGQHPNAFLPAASSTTVRYPGALAVFEVEGGSSFTMYHPRDGSVTIGLPGQVNIGVSVPLARTTDEHGRALAITGLRVCYSAGSSTSITTTALTAAERGDDATTLFEEDITQPAGTNACYDRSVAPRVVSGAANLYLRIGNTSTSPRGMTLHSVTLTLTPVAAGTP